MARVPHKFTTLGKEWEVSNSFSKGMNSTTSSELLKPEEHSNIVNLDLSDSGDGIRNRPGFENIELPSLENSLKVLGYYVVDGFNSIIIDGKYLFKYYIGEAPNLTGEGVLRTVLTYDEETKLIKKEDNTHFIEEIDVQDGFFIEVRKEVSLYEYRNPSSGTDFTPDFNKPSTIGWVGDELEIVYKFNDGGAIIERTTTAIISQNWIYNEASLVKRLQVEKDASDPVIESIKNLRTGGNVNLNCWKILAQAEPSPSDSLLIYNSSGFFEYYYDEDLPLTKVNIPYLGISWEGQLPNNNIVTRSSQRSISWSSADKNFKDYSIISKNDITYVKTPIGIFELNKVVTNGQGDMLIQKANEPIFDINIGELRFVELYPYRPSSSELRRFGQNSYFNFLQTIKVNKVALGTRDYFQDFVFNPTLKTEEVQLSDIHQEQETVVVGQTSSFRLVLEGSEDVINKFVDEYSVIWRVVKVSDLTNENEANFQPYTVNVWDKNNTNERFSYIFPIDESYKVEAYAVRKNEIGDDGFLLRVIRDENDIIIGIDPNVNIIKATATIIPRSNNIQVVSDNDYAKFESPNLFDYKNQFFVYGGSNIIFVSDVLKFNYFPKLNVLNYKFGEIEEVISLNIFFDVLFLGTNKRTFFIKGTTPGDFQTINLNNSIGFANNQAVTLGQNYIYFINDEGIYRIKGLFNIEDRYNIDKIDEPIANLTKSNSGLSKYSKVLSSSDRIYFYLAHNGLMAIYYVKTDAWVVWDSAIFKGIKTLRINDDNTREVSVWRDGQYAKLNREKFVDEVKDNPNDNIISFSPYEKNLKTKSFNSNLPMHKKKYKELVLKTKLQSNELSQIRANIFVDGLKVLDTTKYVVVKDPSTNTVTYSERTEANITQNPGTYINTSFIVDESRLGGTKVETHLIPFSFKGKSIAMELIQENNAPLEILGFGFKQKIKKVKK